MVTDKRLVKSIPPSSPSLLKSTVIFTISYVILGLPINTVNSFPQSRDFGKLETNHLNQVPLTDAKPFETTQTQTSIPHGETKIIGNFETIAGGKNGGGGENGDFSDTLFRERRWGGCGYKGIIGC